MKQKLFSFTQAMLGGWTMQGGQTKQGEVFIALTHEDHKPIIFYRVLKAGKTEKIRQKNIPKKNEDKSENPRERMYLDISSMRKPSMGGRQHWVILVDEATKYKKHFFLKKKNEQVEPIIDWMKALKARHKIQVKIIRCDNERIKSWQESQTRMSWGLFLNIQCQGHHSRMEWWKDHF